MNPASTEMQPCPIIYPKKDKMAWKLATKKSLVLPLYSRAGFTLVEVVITAVIFSIIAIGIAGTFLSGLNLWGRAKGAGVFNKNVVLNMELLARELRSSVYIPQIKYKGSREEVSFAIVQEENCFQVTYKFDGEKKVLSRKLIPLQDILAGKATDSYPEKIFITLDGLTFVYFAFGDGAYLWRENWEPSGKFLAIKIKVNLKNEEFTKTIFMPGA